MRLKSLSATLGCLLLCGALLGACAEDAAVSPQEGLALVKEGGMLLLDVRTDAEFAAGHYPAALHIPVDELVDRVGEVPSDRPVLVYCAAGRRARRAQELLWRLRPDLQTLRIDGEPVFQ